jgi:GT2 family glycosyltransferase
MIPVLIVPVLNQPELLYNMLESIDCKVEKLIVVDNGGHVSRHVVADINREHIANRYVWRFPSNLGVPVSWNLGIKSTPFAPWWLVSNFDVVFPSGALAEFAQLSHLGRIVISNEPANWCLFTIGAQVVEQVGLFDEGIHPAYFEDLDYLRRCQAHGVDVHNSGIRVNHKNSSTLAVGFGDRNGITFAANEQRFKARKSAEDLSTGEWSLATRKALSWD